MVDLGGSPLLLQAPMNVLPCRRIERILQPVRHRCLVAPFKSFGITARCAGANMKARIERSSVHSVRVQKAKWASLKMETARFPEEFFASRAERNEPSKNAGR